MKKLNLNIEPYLPVVAVGALIFAMRLPYFGLPLCIDEINYTEKFFSSFDKLTANNADLFNILYSCIYQIAGFNIVLFRCIALIFSVLTLISIYKLTSCFFGKHTAVAAVTFAGIQNIFVAQSGLILPQMMLTLFTLEAIRHFFKQQYLFSGLFLTLATLTDITSLLTSCILFFAFVFSRKETGGGEFLKSIIFLILPVIIYASRCVVVSIYLKGELFHNISDCHFPLSFLNKLQFVFVGQYRYIMLIFIPVGLIFAFFLKRTNEIPRNFLIILSSLTFIILLFFCTLKDGDSYNLLTICLLSIISAACIKMIEISETFKFILLFILISINSIVAYRNISCESTYTTHVIRVKADKLCIKELYKNFKPEATLYACDEMIKLSLNKNWGYIPREYKAISPKSVIESRKELSMPANYILFNNISSKIHYEASKYHIIKCYKAEDYQCTFLMLKNN